MGGGAKNALGTVGRIGSGIVTLGGSEIARNNLGARNPIAQALQLPGTIMTAGGSGPANMPSVFGTDQGNPYVSGPFSLDPSQLAADQQAINALGEKQYQETIGQVPKVVSDQLSQITPGIEEGLNTQHLLNSSALPQELAHQASMLTQNLVLPATQARQGYQQSSLGRGLSLEDFINQANVAKTIGAQAAPQVGNGKGQTGTLLSGIGSIAGPAAKLATK